MWGGSCSASALRGSNAQERIGHAGGVVFSCHGRPSAGPERARFSSCAPPGSVSLGGRSPLASSLGRVSPPPPVPRLHRDGTWFTRGMDLSCHDFQARGGPTSQDSVGRVRASPTGIGEETHEESFRQGICGGVPRTRGRICWVGARCRNADSRWGAQRLVPVALVWSDWVSPRTEPRLRG